MREIPVEEVEKKVEKKETLVPAVAEGNFSGKPDPVRLKGEIVIDPSKKS